MDDTIVVAVHAVTEQGAGGMRVGMDDIAEIKRENEYVCGDPFEHWHGYDSDGCLLRSISCLCPCDVEYARKDSR